MKLKKWLNRLFIVKSLRRSIGHMNCNRRGRFITTNINSFLSKRGQHKFIGSHVIRSTRNLTWQGGNNHGRKRIGSRDRSRWCEKHSLHDFIHWLLDLGHEIWCWLFLWDINRDGSSVWWPWAWLQELGLVAMTEFLDFWVGRENLVFSGELFLLGGTCPFWAATRLERRDSTVATCTIWWLTDVFLCNDFWVVLRQEIRRDQYQQWEEFCEEVHECVQIQIQEPWGMELALFVVDRC